MAKKPSRPCVTCGRLRWPNKRNPEAEIWCRDCRKLLRSALENRRREDRLANPKWTRLRYREVKCRECDLHKMTNAPYFTCDHCKSLKANRKRRDAARRRLDGRRAPVFERDGGICFVCFNEVLRHFRPPHPGAPAIDKFSRPDRYQLCHLRCLKEVTDAREGN